MMTDEVEGEIIHFKPEGWVKEEDHLQAIMGQGARIGELEDQVEEQRQTITRLNVDNRDWMEDFKVVERSRHESRKRLEHIEREHDENYDIWLADRDSLREEIKDLKDDNLRLRKLVTRYVPTR